MNYQNIERLMWFQGIFDSFFSSCELRGMCTDENNVTYHYEASVFNELFGEIPKRKLAISRSIIRLVLGSKRTTRDGEQIFCALVAYWLGMKRREIKIFLRSEFDNMYWEILYRFLCGQRLKDIKHILFSKYLDHEEKRRMLFYDYKGLFYIFDPNIDCARYSYRLAVLHNDHFIIQGTGERLRLK